MYSIKIKDEVIYFKHDKGEMNITSKGWYETGITKRRKYLKLFGIKDVGLRNELAEEIRNIEG